MKIAVPKDWRVNGKTIEDLTLPVKFNEPINLGKFNVDAKRFKTEYDYLKTYIRLLTPFTRPATDVVAYAFVDPVKIVKSKSYVLINHKVEFNDLLEFIKNESNTYVFVVCDLPLSLSDLPTIEDISILSFVKTYPIGFIFQSLAT